MRLFRILRLPFPNELTAGLFYLCVSFIPTFLPSKEYGYWGSLLFGACYYLGAIYMADVIVRRLTGKAALTQIIGNSRLKWNFIRLGLIGAIPFSLAVCDFGAFWYFPYWSPAMYYIFGYVLLGWVFYFLFLTICYIAFKQILDQAFPFRGSHKRYFQFERRYYKYLGVVGGWFAIMVITVGLQNTRWLTNFNFAVNQPEPPLLYWYWWLIAIAAWIALCEFMCYHRKRSSLLKSVVHGYWTPFVAVWASGILLAITNEIQNKAINLWAYANYPWTGVDVFGVPLFVVLGWPLHIIAFIEFWRAFGDRGTTDLLFEPPVANRNN